MTSNTRHSRSGSPESARLDDLLRADAAAIIDDDLDDEASTNDQGRFADDSGLVALTCTVTGLLHPGARRATGAVRCLASERGVPPTVMLRQWVLTQLDAELGAEATAAKPQVPDAPKTTAAKHVPSKPRRDTATERWEAATAALVDVAAQLTKTLTLFTGHSNAIAQETAGIRTLPPHPSMPATAPLLAFMHSGMPEIVSAAASFGLPASTDASMHLTIRYLNRGLAELRSTVEDASSWPGISDFDLDSLYATADEELSSP